MLCRYLVAAAAALVVAHGQPAAVADTPYLHAPSVDTYAHFNPGGLTILPDGRFIKPVGTFFPVAKWPNGLTLSPDGRTLFVASAHVGQLVVGWDTPSPQTVDIVPDPQNIGDDRCYGGAAVFTPDGKSLYWSSGNFGDVYKVNVAAAETETPVAVSTSMFANTFTYRSAPNDVLKTIALNTTTGGRAFEDSVVMDLALSADGRELYADDVTNFRVAVIDTATDTVVSSIDVGRDPYALAVDGKQVYVANIGEFEYKAIPAPTDPRFDKRGLTFPAFGLPSPEARDGVDDEGRHVPGLGEANSPKAFSVWGLDASDPTHPRVASILKTGLLVGAASDGGATVGGSAPNFLVARGRTLYVSNNNNDMISTVDLGSGRIVRETRIVPSPLTAKLRGVCPTGMTLSPDGSTLYVCEMGLNAIGVMDTRTGRMRGHIPTAWYPYRVTLTHDGRSLIAICFRGFGNGPQLSRRRWEGESPYQGLLGTVHVIPVPTATQLVAMTKNVLTYNGLVDRQADRAKMASPVIPARVGVPSPDIKYVVFIVKENHSFDTIFDHIPGASSDPSMLQWGLHQTISAPGEPTLTDAPVMINHNAIARQFTLSDNFYVQPEASGVGHRWDVGVQPNNWCQMTYTLRWDFNLNSTAPGRLQSFGGNASIAPEDYPEAGTLWDHLAKYNVPFRDYGEGFEFAGVEEDDDEENTGARETVNIPMPEVLFKNTCREFPNFNMSIPDVYRAKLFARDFTDKYLSGKKLAPKFFLDIALCNDHGSDPDPQHGYPYVASWMADDDSGFGKIIDFLTHTPYWKHMAIFVTEDDAGGENDHIDGQRSVMLIISPWARHKYVSHRHTTIMSVHRTTYEIMGMPPLNMFDALANDFSDVFTTKPDFTPYTWRPVDPRIFDPARARDNKDPDYVQARRRQSVIMDDPAVEARVLAAEHP